MLKNIAKLLNSDMYALRLEEAKSEMTQFTSSQYAIFYYNECLFAGSKLSLHLFEPRYKIMMQRVIQSSRKFAYVPNFINYKASIGDVALIANIIEAEFLADGRCLLEAAIEGRYIISDHFIEDGTQGLHFCRLDELHDDPLDAENTTLATQLLTMISTFSNHLISTNMLSRIESKYGKCPPAFNIADSSIWYLSISPIQENQKLNLLKSKDTIGRLRAIIASFSSYVQQETDAA